MSEQVAELLVKAKELIADPERWCQGRVAKDSLGRPTYPNSGNATAWCAFGALERLAPTPDVVSSAVDFLGAFTDGESIGYWNDHHTHAEVMELFDRAIEMANREETGGAS